MKLVRLVGCWLVVLTVIVSSVPVYPGTASAQAATPTIRVTKKTCDNVGFPVFVESHCFNDDSAQFQIFSPSGRTVSPLGSGLDVKPTDPMFLEGDTWYIEDTSRAAQGVTVLSCLQYRPGGTVTIGVAPTTGTQGGAWGVEWTEADPGDGSGNSTGITYRPSIECIWFDLPNITGAPGVLNLQAFTSSSAYMQWTDEDRPGLGEFPRGESSDDLETNMVMSHTTTGAVYSFAADSDGQVLVPDGNYLLQNTDTGYEHVIGMDPYETLLVEIGFGGQAISLGTGGQPITSAPDIITPNDPEIVPMGPELGEWAAAVRYCTTAGDCEGVQGVIISYKSFDGATSGSCITEGTMGPGGPMSLCSFEFIWGVPILLTLDTSTIPDGMVLSSENPIEFLVQENLGGDPALPIFILVPA